MLCDNVTEPLSSPQINKNKVIMLRIFRRFKSSSSSSSFISPTFAPGFIPRQMVEEMKRHQEDLKAVESARNLTTFSTPISRRNQESEDNNSSGGSKNGVVLDSSIDYELLDEHVDPPSTTGLEILTMALDHEMFKKEEQCPHLVRVRDMIRKESFEQSRRHIKPNNQIDAICDKAYGLEWKDHLLGSGGARAIGGSSSSSSSGIFENEDWDVESGDEQSSMYSSGSASSSLPTPKIVIVMQFPRGKKTGGSSSSSSDFDEVSFTMSPGDIKAWQRMSSMSPSSLRQLKGIFSSSSSLMDQESEYDNEFDQEDEEKRKVSSISSRNQSKNCSSSSSSSSKRNRRRRRLNVGKVLRNDRQEDTDDINSTKEKD